MKNNKILSLQRLLSERQFTWQGFINNKNGEWLLITQIIILLLHFLPAYSIGIRINLNLIRYINTTGTILLTLGLIIATSSLIQLGRNLSPLPEPRKNHELVVTGLYSYCRHPLYLSLLISSIGIAFYKSSILHLIIFTILAKILKLKSIREEKSLIKIHSSYLKYSNCTPAIFPRIKYRNWCK